MNSSSKESKSRDSDSAPTIQINDIELNLKNVPVNGTLRNSDDELFNSSSTLVEMEGHSPTVSRSSSPVVHQPSNTDPGDSGYGMEDIGSDLADRHKLSSKSSSSNELSARLSVASDSDYSVSSRSNLSADLDDATEVGYFKKISGSNSSNSHLVRTLRLVLSYHVFRYLEPRVRDKWQRRALFKKKLCLSW